MLNLVFDLTSELRNQKGRELLQKGLVWSLSGQVKSVDARRTREDRRERKGGHLDADQASVDQINEEAIVTEERRAKQWTGHIGDPKGVVEAVSLTLTEGDGEFSTTVRTDGRTVSGKKVRGTGQSMV